MKECVKEMVQVAMNKTIFCSICGNFSSSIITDRKHQFKEHYKYVLLKMSGDKKKLNEWMELKN